MIKFIAAVDSKSGIADDKGIPWAGKVPTDVKYFRDKTVGGIVMMGTGWYNEQQEPLTNRRNVVATSIKGKLRPGFEKVPNAKKYLRVFEGKKGNDIWVGGGAGLFATTIDLADELYLTRLQSDFNCTKFFPEYLQDFVMASESEPITENGITYTFQVWKRK